MKDIEKQESSDAASALDRLQAALMRLERAAATRGSPSTPEATALRQELAAAAKRHAALREAAGQVAARLDETIARLETLTDTGE